MIVKKDSDIISTYTVDSSNFKGYADAVYIPETVEEACQLIKENYEKDTQITFSGAGSGLAGGRVAQGGIVISSEKLNKILNFDEERKLLTVQPAVTTGEISDFLESKGYFLPPNPTERTASIGGNVATNASGSRTYLYGPMRNSVQAIKLSLKDGDTLTLDRSIPVPTEGGNYILTTDSNNQLLLPILDYKIPNFKHAAGYYYKPGMHPIDYFIGAEGTLGFIHEVTLSVIEKSENVLGLIIFFDDIEKCISFVEALQAKKVEYSDPSYKTLADVNPRLIEFFDFYSLKMLREKYTHLNENAQAAIWVEQEIFSNEDEIIGAWYELIGEYTELIDDTWAAQSDDEHIKFRDFRHTLPEKVYEKITQNNQYKVGVDGAVPPGRLRDLYHLIDANVNKYELDRVIYGHIGNNHVHGNVFYTNENEKHNAQAFYDDTLEVIISYGGTVSAEHGIGKLKIKYLYDMFGEDVIAQMKKLKSAIDPKFLFNRGNLFKS